MLKIANNEEIGEMTYNAPMKIIDARSLFIQKVLPNTKPYDEVVIRKNNLLVEEWYQKVLIPLSGRSGTVPASTVPLSFQLFYDGKLVTQTMKFSENLVEIPEEKVRWWIDFISSKTIDELHTFGPSIVRQGFDLIMTAISRHFAKAKWEKIFSQSDDPLQWMKIGNENPHLINGRPVPFGLDEEKLQEMSEKVRALVTIIPQPNN